MSVAVAVVVGLGGCADPDQQGGASVTGQADDGRTTIELAVLEALEDDPRPKGARYEPAEDRVVVTVFAGGEALSAAEVQDLETKAEQVTDGIDVVVEVTDEDPPQED